MILFVLSLLFTFALADYPSSSCHKAGDGYSFCIVTPIGYNASAEAQDKLYPLLISLGGGGATGEPNEAPYLARYDGLGLMLDDYLENGDDSDFADLGKRLTEDFIVLLPIAPKWHLHWDPAALARITNGIVGNYTSFPVDRTRVYLSGYSHGARAVMRTLVYFNNLYAAAICIAGYAEKADDRYIQEQPVEPTFPLLSNVVSTPIAFFGSDADQTDPMEFTVGTYQEVLRLNGTVSLKNYKTLLHGELSKPPFQQLDILDWLLQQVNLPEQQSVMPVTKYIAGDDESGAERIKVCFLWVVLALALATWL